jgi:cytochrome P450
MVPWTFKDGYQLPVGMQISFPTEAYLLDPEVTQDPKVFDAKRHLRKREAGDATKYHMASTADTLVWGKGPYACPGRFMVQDLLKLMFIHILTHYDFKYPEQGDKLRPSPDISNWILTGPDTTMPVLFKEKVY